MNAIPLTSRIRKGYWLSQFLFNTVFEVPDSAVRQGKKTKGIQIGKEEIKPSLFAYNNHTYKKSQGIYKKSSQNSLSEFSKVNLQISIIFQYTSNEQSETENFLNTIYNISKK